MRSSPSRGRQPCRHRLGTWMRSCAAPPMRVAARPPDRHHAPADAEAPQHPADRDADQVEHRRREGRRGEAVLGVQHAHGHRGQRDHRQERQHDPRQEDGQLELVGRLGEVARHRLHDLRRSRRGDDGEDADHREQGAGHPVAEHVRRLGAAALQARLEGRHERLRQRPLGEEIAQEVGDAERHDERVGEHRRAEQRGEQLLADQAEQAREHRGRRDEPGGPDQPVPAGDARQSARRLRPARGRGARCLAVHRWARE